jgi:hypothetical protein
MSKSVPFAIQIARHSDGEQVQHFRSAVDKTTGIEAKIFFTSKKVFLVTISADRKDVDFVCLIRRKNTSLLPIEAAIQSSLSQGFSLGAIAKDMGFIQQEAA